MYTTVESIKKAISYNEKLERKTKEVEQFKEEISKHKSVCSSPQEYLNKNIVKVFYYSTLDDDRDVFKKLDCNLYKKYEIQPVTMVGVVYKIKDDLNNTSKRVLHIGVARHHTKEPIRNSDYEEGLEIARIYAEQSPDAIIKVNRDFDYVSFVTICDGILDSMRLKTMNV